MVTEGHTHVQEIPASEFFWGKKILLLWGVLFKLKKSERDLSGAGIYKKSLPLWLKIY